MQAHEVRLLEKILQRNQIDPKIRSISVAYEGIESQDFHLKSDGALGHERAYFTETHDTQSLPTKLLPDQACLAPAPPTQGSVYQGDPPSQR